jgi:hypothetical protein
VSDHAITLFEVKNARNLILDYRLVAIDGFLGTPQSDVDDVDRNLNTLAKLVAIKEQSPVAIVRRNGKPFLALPADRNTLSTSDYSLVPSAVSLKLEDEVHRLRLEDEDRRHIALKFIEFSLRGPLHKHPELWSSSPRAFLRKRPVNFKESDREVDFFEGFHFHLRFFDDRLFLGLNLSYKYIDSSWLVDRYKPEDLRRLKMRHLLYHFGNQFYVVQLLDVMTRSISETRFVPQGSPQAISVFDYTKEAWKNNPPQWISALNPDSLAITYKSPGRDQSRFAAAALAKLIHRTDDPEASQLHRRSIKQPSDRFRYTEDIVERYFRRMRFGMTELDISPTVHTVRAKSFMIPALEFGQGQVLRVSNHPASGAIALRELPAKRMSMLLDPQAGFAVTSPLDAQYILIPQTLNREVAADFCKNLEATVRGFIHSPYKLDTILYNDKDARTLKQQVDAIESALSNANVSHGHGVLVLPAHANRGLHNYVKSKLNDTMQVQCVSAHKLSSFYMPVIKPQRPQMEVRPDLRGKFTSYLRYTALGLLIVNRQWGWVLPKGTHYDAYVSFDVLNNHAAFSFFYQGGKKCFVRTHRSQQKEKLLRAQVRKIVYEGLKQDVRAGARITSLVLRRDGRLFETEWLGFEDAVKQLVSEGILLAALVFGAVEVQKTTTNAIRIAKTGIDGYRNPKIGVALELSTTEGFVCNTGYPFRINGSVNPLNARVARGQLDLAKILEDTFRMSLLAYSVPDRVMRLPIDMKLCDEFLRAVASQSDEDEATYGEENPSFVEAVNAS